MATTTTNYGLKKPEYSDTADIADINGNMDDIDASLGAKDGALALVNSGDTASQNIASGKYVYVRGHSTLAEGLYTASSAIASGDTLSGSNLTAASDVLNSLKDSSVKKYRIDQTYTNDGILFTGLTASKGFMGVKPIDTSIGFSIEAVFVYNGTWGFAGPAGNRVYADILYVD